MPNRDATTSYFDGNVGFFGGDDLLIVPSRPEFSALNGDCYSHLSFLSPPDPVQLDVLGGDDNEFCQVSLDLSYWRSKEADTKDLDHDDKEDSPRSPRSVATAAESAVRDGRDRSDTVSTFCSSASGDGATVDDDAKGDPVAVRVHGDYALLLRDIYRRGSSLGLRDAGAAVSESEEASSGRSNGTAMTGCPKDPLVGNMVRREAGGKLRQ